MRKYINLIENFNVMEGISGGTFIAYHGTKSDFEKFDNNQLGSAHGGAPINMMGFNFTDKLECAGTFGSKIIAADITINHPYVIDAKGKNYSEFKHVINGHLDDLDTNKYDGIIIMRYADAVPNSDEYIESNHYIPFSASQIKIIGYTKVDK